MALLNTDDYNEVVLIGKKAVDALKEGKGAGLRYFEGEDAKYKSFYNNNGNKEKTQ